MTENAHIAPDPKSLDELFASDPLDLTRQELVAIVTELRAQRARFDEAEKKAKTSPGKPKATRVPGAKAPKLLSSELPPLGDILSGLDLSKL